MKRIIYILIAVVLVSACTDVDDPVILLPDAPELVSSDPANGSVDIKEGEVTITLTYNKNVFCPSAGHEKVTLGDAVISKISANLTKLTITASGLKKGVTYQLVIPEGVVLGPAEVKAPEVSISFSTGAEIALNSKLCTPDALSQAQKVYDFLLSNYGSKIISGAMARVNWNTEEAERVYRWTGKYPALNCFDYVHLYASPANWIDYTNTTVAEDWWTNNGLVAASWHWNVPVAEGSSDYGFYYTGSNNGSGETSFDIKNAVKDGTYENAIVKADLDKIADNLLLLQNKNIPIIWRPLHEAAGGWFWWGKDAESYKVLWRLMFDTFKAKGIKNLIWVWTTETGDDNWYPGDAYVDIVGRDIYNKSEAGDISAEYQAIKAKYPTKMVTLSECGNVANITSQWTSGALWSWFMPWYDYDATDDSDNIHATKEFWVDAFASDKVITRDLMPSLK